MGGIPQDLLHMLTHPTNPLALRYLLFLSPIKARSLLVTLIHLRHDEEGIPR